MEPIYRKEMDKQDRTQRRAVSLINKDDKSRYDRFITEIIPCLELSLLKTDENNRV